MMQIERYVTINVEATGRRIKELRVANGYTADDVAVFCGFGSSRVIFKWQKGETLPSLDNLYALSKLFHTTVDDIIVDEDEARTLCIA